MIHADRDRDGDPYGEGICAWGRSARCSTPEAIPSTPPCESWRRACFLAPMTRGDLEAWTRRAYREARAADPDTTDAIAERIAGGEAWAWDYLRTEQPRAMIAALSSIALATRGQPERTSP